MFFVLYLFFLDAAHVRHDMGNCGQMGGQMFSSRRLLVGEASLLGRKVKLSKLGKQPNLLFFELIKIKPQNVKRNWVVQFLGAKCRPKSQQLNCVWMDGV